MNNTKTRLAESVNLGIMLPEVCLVSHIARVLHLTPSTVQALIRRGEIPAKKIGRSWVISRTEFLRVISNRDPLRILVD